MFPPNNDHTLAQALLDIQRLRIGIPADFWLTHAATIGQFIKEHKLTPVSAEALGVGLRVKQATSAKSSQLVDSIIDLRGGRKIAHLHYNGDLYVLTAAQWQAFTAPVLENLRTRLSQVNSIGFHSFLEVNEGFAGIPQQAAQKAKK